MKKSIFLTFLMAMMAMSFTYAQDLDEILENHFETIGQENLLDIESMLATGKAAQMGMEFPFTMINKRPGMLKLIINVQGAEIIQAFDGETVWVINPMSGSADPVDITGPEADGLIESADMDGQLWKYKEKGHQLELEGTEEIDGTEAFVLKLTKKNGNIDYYYLEQESYLIFRMKSKTIINGSEVETEVLFSNYQDVEGYIMPFTTEQKQGGQTVMTILMEEVKTNTEPDDTLFSKPVSK
ncbi:MAG: hypothetical protein ABFS10_02570 [Bacteroidota bacterium]